ncbi:MAG: ATPase [Betaproteobacteria bacterium]|nr:ATPase [Betaproteobacteria bacterium]
MTDTTVNFYRHAGAGEIRYIVGVDGGGSLTRARLTSLEGSVLGYGEAGPSGLSQGVDQALSNTSEAIAKAFQAAHLPQPPQQQCAVGMGLAGTGISARAEELLRRAHDYGMLRLDSDAYTALIGAHLGLAGAIVIAGTGSAGLARHADGRRVSVGGWGFPSGDEGSGAWLGLRALCAAQQAADGRVLAGPLAHAVWALTGATRAEILAWEANASQFTYAQLAPAVFDSATADPKAAELLYAAAAALHTLVITMDSTHSLPICILGSVGRRLQPLLPEQTRARCVEPASDAVNGAVLMIREDLAII